jgi:hypothetical protein
MSAYLFEFSAHYPLTLAFTGVPAVYTLSGKFNIYSLLLSFPTRLFALSAGVILCFASVALVFILVVVVLIFSYLIGLSAALFAAWFTYGIAGAT